MNRTIAFAVASVLCTACDGGNVTVIPTASAAEASPSSGAGGNTTASPAPAPVTVSQPVTQPKAVATPAWSIQDLGSAASGGINIASPPPDTSTGDTIYRTVAGFSVGMDPQANLAIFMVGGQTYQVGPGVLYDYDAAQQLAVGAKGQNVSGAPPYFAAVVNLSNYQNNSTNGYFLPSTSTVGSEADGINDSGEIVGVEDGEAGAANSAVAWISNVEYSLSTQEVDIIGVYGISCSGAILAFGMPTNSANAPMHTYLLTRTDISRSCTS